ncbi:MAG: hypothetical protein ABMA64_28670 [Myxococcota bacterium]|jgi:hypothetical protein
MVRWLRWIFTHPLTQVVVGLCMFGTGAAELVELLGEGLSSAHGVALYGLIHTGKAVIELLEGLEKVGDAESPRE